MSNIDSFSNSVRQINQLGMKPPLKLLEMDKVPLLHLFQSGTLNQLWSHINPSINPAKSYPTLYSKIFKKIEEYLKSLFYN